jgi:hypothetical protein
VDPVSDPLLLRKSGNIGNGTRDLRVCSQELLPLDRSWSLVNDLNLISGVAMSTSDSVSCQIRVMATVLSSTAGNYKMRMGKEGWGGSRGMRFK